MVKKGRVNVNVGLVVYEFMKLHFTAFLVHKQPCSWTIYEETWRKEWFLATRLNFLLVHVGQVLSGYVGKHLKSDRSSLTTGRK